jgi:hypothetical protein
MKLICRWMQRGGLWALPVAIVLQMVDVLSVGEMLVAAVAGMALFWLGRILEGYAST